MCLFEKQPIPSDWIPQYKIFHSYDTSSFAESCNRFEYRVSRISFIMKVLINSKEQTEQMHCSKMNPMALLLE